MFFVRYYEAPENMPFGKIFKCILSTRLKQGFNFFLKSELLKIASISNMEEDFS